MQEPQARIAALLRDADDIIITTHANPDGDAIGSLGAMGHVLATLGKRFCLCNVSGVPSHLSWVPLPGQVYTSFEELPFQPRLAIVLDCGDEKRPGEALRAPLAALPSINIDHHQGNPLFGTVDNWVEPQRAATGEMVAEIALALGQPLAGALGECLYLALVSDTGSFSFGNTSARVLSLAAEIVGNGLDVAALTERHDNQWSFARMQLWGRLMQEMRLAFDGTVAISVIPDALIESCGARRADLEGWASQMRKVRGVRVSVMVRGNGPEGSKVSLRSTGPDDVRAVAARFGGGGHRNAAGVEMSLPPEEASRQVVAALGEQLGLDGDGASLYV